MIIEKNLPEQKIKRFFKNRRGFLIIVGIVTFLVYSLFYILLTYLTDEKIIDLLSRRSPPTELLMPGQVIDREQTKDFKRQKLAQLKGEVDNAKKELLNSIGLNRMEQAEDRATQVIEKAEDRTPWQTLKDNFFKLEKTFDELLAITIVSYPGQEAGNGHEVEQTLMVGLESKPINLNDQVLRWQKEIEAAAERYHLEPALIAAVIEQESGGNPEAISLVGAIGLMQLMPSTAELMGVNPYNPAQNIEGGAHYLRQQLDRFGNLETALAAYNAGPGTVENGSWVNIPETMNYIQKVPQLLLKYEKIWRDNQGRV